MAHESGHGVNLNYTYKENTHVAIITIKKKTRAIYGQEHIISQSM